MLVASLGAAGAALIAAEPTADPSLLQWINTGGVFGLGAFFLVAFMGGRLVSEKFVAALTAEHVAQVATLNARVAQLEQQQREDKAELIRLVEKIAGPLEQSAQALRDSSQGYGRVIEDMRPPRNDLDVILRRMEHLADEMGRQQQGKEP